MDLGLKNQVVLVAGASKGIGFAVARAFAMEGAKVAMCSSNADRIQTAAKAIYEETRTSITAAAVNVTKKSEVQAWIDAVYEKFGAIHVCITNTAGPKKMSFVESNDEAWHDAINLTLMSVVHLSHAVISKMKQQSFGRLIHICSASVRHPIPNLVFSNAIRAAVVALGKTQADELAKDGILVNSILPGWTNTERTKEVMAARAQHANISVQEAIAIREKAIPLNRMAQADEIANPIVFLASERASFITGTTLTVDGGESRFPF